METPGLDRSDIRKMAATQRRRQAQKSRRAVEQAALARQEVERLARAFLALAPDIERIVLFGSLAHDRGFRHGSDIDLAIRCRPEMFLPLVAEALRSPFAVDVIDLATADTRLLAGIEEEGEVIYAK